MHVSQRDSGFFVTRIEHGEIAAPTSSFTFEINHLTRYPQTQYDKIVCNVSLCCRQWIDFFLAFWRVGIFFMAVNLTQTAANTVRTTVSTVSAASAGTVRSVSLLIAGQRITIRTDQSEEYLNALAAEVNGLVDSLRKDAPGAGMPQLMSLAMVMLADRACAAEKAAMRESDKVERHIERLTGILNALEDGSYQK